MSESTTLALAPADAGKDAKRADLPAIRQTFLAQVAALKTTAETLTVTDATQLREMKLARETRLSLRDIRLEITSRHKEMKADILARGQELDAFKRELLAVIEPLELRLEEQEKFADRAEAARLAQLARERQKLLAKYDVLDTGVDLGSLSAAAFDAMLLGAKNAWGERQANAFRAEEERVERERIALLRAERAMEIAPLRQFISGDCTIPTNEQLGVMPAGQFAAMMEKLRKLEKKDQEDREAVRLENERLKKEAKEIEAERDRLAKIEDRILAIREGETDAIRGCKTAESVRREIEYVERREITAELFQERLEEAQAVKVAVLKSMREILADREQAELFSAQQAAAAQVEAERLASERAAAAAPDKAKLLAMAERAAYLLYEVEMTTEPGKQSLAEITVALASFVALIRAKAETL